jgi:hypothetical protein
MNLPNRVFHGLYVRAIERQSTESAAMEEAVEEMQEQVEGG